MKIIKTTRYAQLGTMAPMGQPQSHAPSPTQPQAQPQQPQGQQPGMDMDVEASDPDLEHEQALEHQEQQILNSGDHQQGGMERLPGGIKPPGNPTEPEANVDAWHPEQDQTAFPAGEQRKPSGQLPAGGLGEAFNQSAPQPMTQPVRRSL